MLHRPKLPSWWTALMQRLDTLERQGVIIMAAIDDLNAVVQTLVADVSSAVTELQDLISKLGTTPPDNAAAIEAAVSQLSTLATNLETAVAAAKTAAP